MTTDSRSKQRTYIVVWITLLTLSAGMLLVDTMQLAGVAMATVLIVAMILKSGLISSYFMHLRFEGPLLVLSVVLGLFALGAVLFVLMVPDALRLRDLAPLR